VKEATTGMKLISNPVNHCVKIVWKWFIRRFVHIPKIYQSTGFDMRHEKEVLKWLAEV